MNILSLAWQKIFFRYMAKGHKTDFVYDSCTPSKPINLLLVAKRCIIYKAIQ